jgi:hypothetical protein
MDDALFVESDECVLTLGLRLFPKPRKAKQIVERIELFIQEYDISYEKIITIITDNGSDLCLAEVSKLRL